MQQKQRKIPMRMCSGCGEMKPKRELIRVVHQKEGAILLDPTGKLSGSGAYICPDPECLKKARKARRLEKSFACRISDEVYAALETAMADAAEQRPVEENRDA